MKKTVYLTLGTIALFGCSDHNGIFNQLEQEGVSEMEILCSIDQVYLSRVNDGGFANGDAIGVYIMDYEGSSTNLKPSGNHADNVKFIYNSSSDAWSGDSKLYWKDSHTQIDAISYYPYINEIADVRALPFSIQHQQDKEMPGSSMSSYEASDFLWAKQEHISPMSIINLTHKHIMACAQLSLIEGEGFEKGEWERLEKIIEFTNISLDGLIDLSNGIVITDTDSRPSTVTPSKFNNDWRCIVLPQTLSEGTTLIQISLDGEVYEFKQEQVTEYVAGKMHKFCIKVDKGQSVTGDYVLTLISESIGPWENDNISHDSEAKAYITVEAKEAGRLGYAINSLGIQYEEIINLKIVGEMNENDFYFIRDNLGNLEALNLKDTKTVNCHVGKSIWSKGGNVIPDNAFTYEDEDLLFRNFRYIVFPDNLKAIGERAFENSSLIQDLILPEGFIYLGNQAFWGGNCILKKVELPSTLTYLGDGALSGIKILEISPLPENIEYLGEFVFAGSKGFNSNLRLPQVNEIKRFSFEFCDFTGSLVLPSTITKVGEAAFWSAKFTSLILNEGLLHIEKDAFRETPLKGDLVIPSSVIKIEEGAFRETKFSHIYFKNSLEEIEDYVFFDCEELVDTLKFPSSLKSIGRSNFVYSPKLTAVIFPEKLETIGEDCFKNCYDLKYIECQSEQPPVFSGSDQFAGVAKNNFTLVVPKGCVDAYRNAPGWAEFKRISEQNNFVCRPQNALFLNKASKRSIIINSENEWEITQIPQWINVDIRNGNKKTEITVNIEELPKGSQMRSGSIVFSIKGTDITTRYNVEQYDYEYTEDQEVVLQKASKGKGIDLVIVGDGYDAKDIAEGIYIEEMEQSIEYFFDVEPYKSYRDYFNVYTAIAMSEESGIGTLNTLRNVKFGTFVGDNQENCNGIRMSCNFDDVLFYCIDNTRVNENDIDALTCIVIPNTSIYEGVTKMYPGSYGNGAAVALCPKSNAFYPSDARGIVQHEAGGHGFGKLVDEYIYHSAWIQTCSCTDDCGHVMELIKDQQLGWGRNLSLSGKYNQVEWSHLISDNSYNDIVDIYEGGYFHSRGVFRSEVNSCMNDNIPYFSTWSRELIVQRIMELAGETFSYEQFKANDSRQWGKDFTSSGRSNQNESGTLQQYSHLHRRSPIISNSRPKRKSNRK